jgi:hypothetical protein
MAKARRRFYDKSIFPDGAILEMVIWELPQPDAERPHGLKYSLYYGKNGIRIIGYDNEKGKGDHRHYLGIEEAYFFISPQNLVQDFLSDVERHRRQR